MIICTVLLLFLSVYILILNPKNPSNIWCGIFLFFTSIGTFTVIMHDHIIPLFETIHTSNSSQFNQLLYFQAIASYLSHSIPIYAFLMFCLYYSGTIINKTHKIKIIITLFTLIPTFVIAIFFPVQNFSYYYDSSKMFWLILSTYATTYYIIGTYLLIKSFLKERLPKLRKQRIFVAFLILPASGFSLVSNYILMLSAHRHYWRYGTFFVIFTFIFFLVISIKYGIMGVKLKLSRVKLDSNMKALSSGNLIINHSVKNEISKIKLSVEMLKSDLPSSTQNHCAFNIIQESITHLLNMSSKLNNHLEKITLNSQPISLKDSVSFIVNSSRPLVLDKNITIISNITDNIFFLFDKAHFYEILNNIIKNAIDAIKLNGTIVISSYKTNSCLIISIKDDGPGICEKNISHIFEPFFSTGNSKHNYGLGLAYCYTVMKQAKGDIEIKSKEGLGTTVTLYFPI